MASPGVTILGPLIVREIIPCIHVPDDHSSEIDSLFFTLRIYGSKNESPRPQLPMEVNKRLKCYGANYGKSILLSAYIWT